MLVGVFQKQDLDGKTNSYDKIFNTQDNEFLKNQIGIDFSFRYRRKKHHKRAYYGLFSLVSWLRENT